MEAPIGFSQDYKKGEGYKFKKTLYGLKQSPKSWFGSFTLAIKRFGYKQSNSNYILFLKTLDNKITCLIIYVH